MKTADQLADMSPEAFESYLKRKRLFGMAAVNLSKKRRDELARRDRLDDLATAIELGQDGHETQP